MHVLLMAMLCSPLGPTGAPWGVNCGPILKGRMPVLTGRTFASGCQTLLPFSRLRESWWLGLPPGACSELLLLLMLRTRALMPPTVGCGGMTCLASLLGRRVLSCLWVLMRTLVRLCLSLLGVAYFASRRTIHNSGSLFHRTLVGLGLRVPATFGAVDTWVANGGSTHRIDYVAVPLAWDCDHGACSRHCVAPREVRDDAPCSLHVVDSAGNWEDHFLVVLRVNLALWFSCQAPA